MMTPRGAVAVVICSALAVGCRSATAPGTVLVTLDQSRYIAGNVVTGSITNTSSHLITYNLCQRDLDRRVSSGWTTVIVVPPEGAACNTEGFILSPGGRAQFTFAIPTDLAVGTYRIRFLELLGGVSTPSFAVGR